ncbi:hypothetical protein [Sphingobium sp.]|uniref:hypothetical protein n=1 Tax=Sphingobium sp. TaxID=1912891 RepID=UPI002C194084|nr:hypothetical protein [Sphingobium sp.]HUD93875.1 hypothetical protein [Sphingobium sp.]
MVRQGHLFVAAPIRRGLRDDLESLLATMTHAPGQADPDNALLPFGQLEQLHVARFVLLDDPSLPDRIALAESLPIHEPVRLAFVADFDGDEDDFVRAITELAATGLRQIFSCCIDFDDDTDLIQWMRRHAVRSAANYINWPGRGTRQIAEEVALHRILRAVRIAHDGTAPEALWPKLAEAGRAVPLTPLDRPGIASRLRDFGHFLLLPVIGLVLLPLILIGLVPFILLLRHRERTDPILAPVPDRARNRLLSAQEDHDITNQYGAIGSLKPGLFRRWLTIAILWVIGWGARHIYRKGRLARVNTIHFASWTFLDDRRRVYFASNYDGSREAYNDDFINKVAFGLNLSFSNGLGYPRTDWLILGGARHEQDFKRYLFHHQIPTQVWYKAFPGLSNYDMARNARIRAGFEAAPVGAALRRWIAEI